MLKTRTINFFKTGKKQRQGEEIKVFEDIGGRSQSPFHFQPTLKQIIRQFGSLRSETKIFRR